MMAVIHMLVYSSNNTHPPAMLHNCAVSATNDNLDSLYLQYSKADILYSANCVTR